MRNNIMKKIPKGQIEKRISSVNFDRKVKFTFKYLDRKHELFNLGNCETNPQVVEKEWFLDLLDCLKRASEMDIDEFLKDSLFDAHPVDWNNSNTKKPDIVEQADFWQFRISKSKGRIIGILLDEIFHIVWLDRHHNLTNSEGYGKEKYYYIPKSIYELQEDKIESLEAENKKINEEIIFYKEMIEQFDIGRK